MHTHTGSSLSDNTKSIRQDVDTLKQNYAPQTFDSFGTTYERIEKISAALYIVTSHLSEREPVVYALRGIAADLVNAIYAQTPGYVREHSVLVNNLLTTIQRAIAHVRMAMIAQLVSETNGLLLERELLRAHTAVASEFANLQGMGHTPAQEQSLAGMFDVSQNETPRVSLSTPYPRPAAVEPQKTVVAAPVPTPRTETTPSVVKPLTAKVAAPSETSDVRTGMIMMELGTKPEVTIRDLIPLLPGVSEKTIQRDLQVLVTRGLVQKVGERRWAKYTLSQ